MKKGNLLFLVLFIILFIISVIPMFQNVMYNPVIIFFGNKSASFSSIYMPLVVMSMANGILLFLYIQSLLKDLNRKDATKFDLSN